MRHPHVPASPARQAITKGITGMVVGLTIFALLSLLRGMPVVGPFVRHLQIVGIDLGLYVESFVHPMPRAMAGANQYRYVFLDVDRAACKTLYPHDPACTPTAPADRRIVGRLIRAARESGALVVVVDIATVWPAPAGPDLLADALTTRPAAPASLPPVVIPLLFDIGPRQIDAEGRPVYAIQPMRDLSGPPASALDANVFFGLPLGSSGDSVLAGDMVRAYARALDTDAMTEASGPGADWTLAGAAECLARHQDNDLQSCRSGRAGVTPKWIRFSVPPLLAQPDEDVRSDAVRRGRVVRYLAASEQLPLKEDAAFPAALVLRGAIVVIGSSRDGRDYHATPLGPMTGAEIVLNAIRSFLEFRVVGDTGWFGSLFSEAQVVACTAAIFAVFWWIVSRRPRRGLKPQWWLWHATIRVAGFLVAWVIAVVVAFGVVLWAIAVQSESRWDVVTPVLITVLEGTAEGLHVMIGSVEGMIERAHAAAARIYARRTANPNKKSN